MTGLTESAEYDAIRFERRDGPTVRVVLLNGSIEVCYWEQNLNSGDTLTLEFKGKISVTSVDK